jgi:hypothetical protein
LHNVLGHPVMGLLHLLGFKGAGDWVHEVTLPKERLVLGAGESGEGDQLVLSMCMQAEFEESLMGEVEEALVEVLGDMGEGGEGGDDGEGDDDEGGVFR